jgi:hypothetical protein
MRNISYSILTAAITLAFAGTSYAASNTTENLTVFTNTKAGTAQQVLKQNASRFGLPASLDNLAFVKVKESLLGKHYHYQQMLRGYPVDDAEIIVSIGHNGQLNKIFNETKPVSAFADNDAVNQMHNQKVMSSDEALDHAWNNMKVQHPLVDNPKTSLVWVADDNGLHLAYKVHISAQMPTGGFVQYISAHDGSLLKSYTTSLPRNSKNGERVLGGHNNLKSATLDRKAAMATIAASQKKASRAPIQAIASGINGSGNVFDPDPRTALGTDSLTDTSSASAFDAAYSTKSMRDLTVSGGVYALSGPYVNIKNIESPNTAPSTTTNGVWTAKRGNNAFDDSNIYFHIDQNQRYIQSLGFTGTKSIINRPLDVDSDGVNGDDNSHYSSGGSSDYLAFGHGCVNDGEDADVILHEYGHGIQANINSSWTGGDTGAMGEGFGDYWAASYSYSTPNGKTYHPEWAFSWDGHGACWDGRVLNRTDAKYNSTKTYGAHSQITEGSVSFQSDELWSAPLFQSLVSLVAAGKSRDNVDKIILEAHFGLGSGVKMPAMATAIVNAAHNLFPNDATYENTFRAKFEAQNILTSTTTPPTGGSTINETESNNTASSANTVSTSGTTVNGTMSASSDSDYFKITLPAGKTITATMTPNSTSDYDLYLYNSNGTSLLKSSENGTGSADTISYISSKTRTVYVRVKYYSGGTGSTNGKYSMLVGW